jgi:primary-amine oxidase
MLMQPGSLVSKRGFFASKHLFVTPFAEGQLFPAGDHVVQSEDCLGLKQWMQEVRACGVAVVAWPGRRNLARQ